MPRKYCCEWEIPAEAKLEILWRVDFTSKCSGVKVSGAISLLLLRIVALAVRALPFHLATTLKFIDNDSESVHNHARKRLRLRNSYSEYFEQNVAEAQRGHVCKTSLDPC